MTHSRLIALVRRQHPVVIMAELLRLFVSATNDLEAERAIVGKAIAQLPVQIGVEIRRTPVSGASYEDIYEDIANVDRFYFLMGEDITAPAGAEWFLAWKLERSILPLRRAERQTPAAQEFLRRAPIEWPAFRSRAELARIITLDIARILHHTTNRYGLSVLEFQRLDTHVERIKRLPISTRAETGGAEGGGVLLDFGHREPILGVELDESAN